MDNPSLVVRAVAVSHFGLTGWLFLWVNKYLHFAILSNTPKANGTVSGYTCFLSLSDRVQREKGEFFLQPHTTEVVWGGRKVVFIFQHHSGRFGLYYDILCPALVGAASGGGPRLTSTILTKGRTFIPVPDEIANDFLPKAGERKWLEIRCDILYLGELENLAS